MMAALPGEAPLLRVGHLHNRIGSSIILAHWNHAKQLNVSVGHRVGQGWPGTHQERAWNCLELPGMAVPGSSRLVPGSFLATPAQRDDRYDC